MRRVGLVAAAIAVALVAASSGARAEARHAAMVIDANSGEVLHAQAADSPRYPASLTKMMTLYMAFELIDAGRLSYTTRIKISQEAASAAPSKLDLDPGEDIALIDAIKALVTKSANDIAIAVAEHIGGSEQNFARLMTAKARQIGMAGTTFRNASGLPDPGQVTTARDMLTLALRLQDDFPRHYPLFATRAFSFAGSTHRNHNTLLGTFAGIDGIKTGYTRASGFNLVSSVRRDGRHVVAAVFGGTTAASRNAHMRSLLTRALARAATVKTRKPVLVAKPRPAPRPPTAVAAAVPRPERAAERTDARTAAPPPRPVPSVTETAATVEPGRAEPPAAAPEPAPPSPPIEIAKVRRVMVAPRLRPRREVESDHRGGTTEEAPEALSPVRATETVLAKPASAAARAPEAPAQVAAAQPPLAAQSVVATAVAAPQRLAASALPSPAVARPAERPVAQPARAATAPAIPQPRPEPALTGARAPATPTARPPSTLQQQAVALAAPATANGAPPAAARPPTQPSYRLQGPSTPAAPAVAGGFQIQVGAFASTVEAERHLAGVRGRAGTLLASHPNVALPVRKGERQLYRARFAGFDANGAASACLELRRLGVDCFVMKAE